MLRNALDSSRRWFLRKFVADLYWPAEVTVDGAIIPLRGTPFSFGTRKMICEGSYEVAERSMIGRLVRPGMNVLELGGSIGVVAAILAHRVGITGRVISVEASPTIAQFSGTWLESHHRVKVLCGLAFPVWTLPHNLRVGGFVSSPMPLLGRVQFSVDGAPSSQAPADSAKPDLAIPRTLDLSTICRENGMHPNALVVDIEGSEEVLRTCRAEFPASIKVLIMEMHPGIYKDGKAGEQAVIDRITGEGFRQEAHVGDTYSFIRE